jgi:hypothetical protein
MASLQSGFQAPSASDVGRLKGRIYRFTSRSQFWSVSVVAITRRRAGSRGLQDKLRDLLGVADQREVAGIDLDGRSVDALGQETLGVRVRWCGPVYGSSYGIGVLAAGAGAVTGPATAGVSTNWSRATGTGDLAAMAAISRLAEPTAGAAYTLASAGIWKS